jgi:hypothetical protein
MCICLKHKYILNLKVNDNIGRSILHFRLHKNTINFWEQLTVYKYLVFLFLYINWIFYSFHQVVV